MGGRRLIQLKGGGRDGRRGNQYQGAFSRAEYAYLQGVVKSTSPLKIQAVNDDKLTVGPGNVIVPRHLTDYDTEVTVHWQTEAVSGGSGYPAFASHAHPIEGRKAIRVHNGLKTGERVHLLALNHGKQYFVLGRVV